jgi:hypothetical protein
LPTQLRFSEMRRKCKKEKRPRSHSEAERSRAVSSFRKPPTLTRRAPHRWRVAAVARINLKMSDQHPRSAFVARICAMASDSENLFPGCCSWGSHGDSFQIHDRETFETRVLPHYSSSSNLKSFIRQLNRHGFRKERSWAHVIE